MSTYRKKSTVEATQFSERGFAIAGVCTGGSSCKSRGAPEDCPPHVHTLEGDLSVSEGDWILTGIDGEHWPVRNDIFVRTYEAVSATDDKLNGLLDRAMKTNALVSVLSERAKQIEQWGLEHDDNHVAGELALAASRLANPNAGSSMATDGYLPWAVTLRNKYEDDPRKLLVIAAALLLAEIERLDRE